MNNWLDFNTAEDQQEFEAMPKGTLVKVRMTIKPGGYIDHDEGWTDGLATLGDSGAVYLSCEFVVLAGQYAKRKFWSLIGLHSPKGDKWANMGRTLIKGILNSARGLKRDDNSDSAIQARFIESFEDLNGIDFVAKLGVDKDMYDDLKNVLASAVTPDHKDYAAIMSEASSAPQGSLAPAQAAYTPPRQNTQHNAKAQTHGASKPTGKPAWAE